jgi:glycosyltransferase involved in cell wall biosynthesis
LVEAMAAGAPVVASRTTAVGETAGSAGLLVDPMDEADIARALRLVLEDQALAEHYRALGFIRAAEFTWGRTMDCLVRSWRRALDAS